MLELGRLVPLGAGGDLERAHVLGGVDAGEVEGERIQAPADDRLRGRREVAVPGLVHGAGVGHVEAYLHDPVVVT